MNRNILHLRVNAFPVAVERLRDRSLKNQPVVICSRHSPRSLIFCASREARQEGVWEGLPLTRALQRCRKLVILPPDERLYRKAAGEITRVLDAYSPLVESQPSGRFYVDMTGTARLFGNVQDSAYAIRRRIKDAMSLESTLGLATNKLVSGIAARVVESHGDLYTVPAGSEASFLAPLRVQMLPGVHSRKDWELLKDFNIRWIWQLRAFSLLQLVSVFGKRGMLLHRQALGIDQRPVLPPASKSFVLEEKTLDEDTNDDSILLGVLYGMMEQACQRMRCQRVVPRTVWLHVRYTDGVDATRRFRSGEIRVTEPLLFQDIKRLFMETSLRRQRIRYLSLTFTDLAAPSGQMTLFENSRTEPLEERLVSAMDMIREKYGQQAIRTGRAAQGA